MHSRYVKIHVLIALTVGRGLEVTRTSTFDLHTASGFLLDMLDVGASMTNNLSAQVEPLHRLKTDGYFGFGPFTLKSSQSIRMRTCFLAM